MDSNFQVTIQANIQSLQKSIKEAKSTLAQFDVSANKAADATKNMEQNANRGRLATFAFGQVIRDAGFFSQSFGLGLLAISNNIPILIDQLALSVKALAPFVGIISLMGSLLTAGLTIWAYSAQGVDEFTSSVKEYTKAMNEAKASSQTEILTLQTLLSIASDHSRSLSQRQDAINQLNNKYDAYNNSLTINNVNSKKNIDVTDRLTQSILLQAQASAEAANYTKLQAQLYETQDKSLEDHVGWLGKSAIYLKEYTQRFPEFAAGVLTMDPTKVKNAWKDFDSTVKGVIGFKGMEAYGIAFDKLSPAIDESKKRLKGFLESLSKLGLTKPNKDIGETISLLDKLNQIFGKTRDLFDGGGLLLVEDQQIKDGVEFIDLIDELIYKGKTLEEVNNSITESTPTTYVDTTAIRDAYKSYDELKRARDGYFDVVELQGLKNSLMEALVPSDTEIAFRQWTMLADGISNILGNTFVDLGNLISGSIGGAEFWGGILQSIGSFLSAFCKQLIAFGVGMKVYALAQAALLSGNPLLIGSAATTLLIAGATLATIGGIISGLGAPKGDKNNNNSGSRSGGGGTYGGVRPFASGGIVSGPTNALIGEYPGARNNPEVVAPLDKLTKIIGGSIGGGDMGGQLSARISGNDLVILLDRASKNRKNYF
jgi:hypothetical protein